MTTREEFVAIVRFAFDDGPESQLVQREKLSDRPGNLFDGQNRGFFLFNRRITSLRLYDDSNTDISGTSVTSATGFIEFTTAPDNPNIYADYCWQKLTDAEIDRAIKMAEATGGFNSSSLVDSQLDYATAYALAYCYQSACSRCASYYTVSAAGKQVSKSELFNHYNSLFTTTKQAADTMRLDYYTDRGQRNIPAESSSAPEYARPYIDDSGGG